MYISRRWTMALILGLLPLAATATNNCNPVGTWAVNVTFPPEADIPPFSELISFLPGGVAIESNSELHPNSVNPFIPLTGSTGHGAWERRQNCRIKFKLLKQIFDPTNHFVGFIRITVRAKIAGHGYSSQFADSNVELVFGPDPDAPPVTTFGGSTSEGRRVRVD